MANANDLKQKSKSNQRNGDQSFQQIFYGAPGTGKSYTINRDTAGEDVIRRIKKALSVQEIIDYWSKYTRYSQSSWIIGNQAKYDSLSERDKKRTYHIKTENDESLWVNTNGWMYQDGPGDILRFIKAVNDAGIGITVEENRE